MDDDVLLIRRDGRVATLTLNRPKVLNALNAELLARLGAALAELDADPNVRAVILTGSGDRAFAAGADIGELNALTGAADGERLARAGQAITLAIEQLRAPVIAAVNGFALGGGCELAMACDIRIASTSARFGQPEVNLGLIPGYGGTQRLARLAGTGAAMLLCLGGEPIDAAEALRIGLVQSVVAPGELVPAAERLAATIAERAPLAVAATKRAIRDGAALGIHEALALEAAHFGAIVASADMREGTRAFLDKRKPAFRGE
jgi:enoyl-CoA hydratase